MKRCSLFVLAIFSFVLFFACESPTVDSPAEEPDTVIEKPANPVVDDPNNDTSETGGTGGETGGGTGGETDPDPEPIFINNPKYRISKIMSYANGSLNSQADYSYSNNSVETITFSSDGSYYQRTVSQYSSGVLLDSTVYNASGEIQSYTEYGPYGVTMTRSYTGMLTSKITYQYNSLGKISSTNTYVNDVLNSSAVYSYENENNYTVVQKAYDDNGDIINSYTYNVEGVNVYDGSRLVSSYSESTYDYGTYSSASTTTVTYTYLNNYELDYVATTDTVINYPGIQESRITTTVRVEYRYYASELYSKITSYTNGAESSVMYTYYELVN